MSIPSSVLAEGWIPFVIVLVVSHEITFPLNIMRTFGKPSRMQQLDQTSSTNTHSDTHLSHDHIFISLFTIISYAFHS